MIITSHEKVYEKLKLKTTKINITLDTVNDELDNIIYYLICAQDKKNIGEFFGYENRLEAAIDKLSKFNQLNQKET
jgi:hypothetical protein